MRADLAGNTLLTARDVATAALTTSPQGFYDSTSQTDQTDLYRFSLSSQSKLQLNLSQMTGDSDLQVLDRTGKQLYSSNQSSKLEDTLTVDLAAGEYFINVANFSGDSDYYLQIANASTPPPIVVPDPIVPIVPIAPVAPPVPATAIDPKFSAKPLSGQLPIDALINTEGSYWDSRASGGVITYSFYQASSGPYYGTEQVSELNAAIKASVREIFKNLETYIDQKFVEVADTANNYGVIRYMFSNGGGGANADYYAYSYYPWSQAIGSDVHLNPIWDARSYASFSNGAGSNGYTTLIHETLHALGLKHPGNYDALSDQNEGPFLDPQQDNKANTVLSYNRTGTAAITPLTYDIRALQYLYGAKATAATDTTYQFTTPMFYTQGGQSFGNPAQGIYQSLWDSGGIDTIDLSGSRDINYHIDLRDSGLVTSQLALTSSIYTDIVTNQGFAAPQYGTSLSAGTVIENVISSAGNDRIIANSATNRFSGYSGAFGNDQLENTNGADLLDLSGNQRSQLRLANNAGDLTIDWGTGKSIRVTGYFGTSAAMKILIEGQYFAATASGTWQISAAPAANDRVVVWPMEDAIVPAAESIVKPTVAVAPIGDQAKLPTPPQRCHCQSCQPPQGLNLLGRSALADLVGQA
jgi:Bacterial pre-peptidase C-terminal domain/Peptidase M10 serralysin C terminal